MTKPKGRGGKRGGAHSSNYSQAGFHPNNQYNNEGNGLWQTPYGGNGAGGFQAGYNNGYYSNYGGNGGYAQGGFQIDNYNGNQEWYSNDSYSNDFNNGGHSNAFGQPPVFPRNRRGSELRRGRGQRGGPKQTIPFKAQNVNNPKSQQLLSRRARRVTRPNGAAQLAAMSNSVNGGKSTNPTTVLKKKGQKQKKTITVNHIARISRKKEKLGLKNKYKSSKQNKNLNSAEQLVLTFLKEICRESCEEKKKLIHFVLFSQVSSGHRNAVKIFTYEARKLLGERYDSNNEEDKDNLTKYLENYKKNFIDGFKKAFNEKYIAEVNLEESEKLLDQCMAKLSGQTFTDDDIPVPKDYLFAENHSTVEEDFIMEFKQRFVYNCFECFFFKPDESKMPTRDRKKRLAYFLDNPIIPFIIVESVRAKVPLETVPSSIDKYISPCKDKFRQKIKACMNDALEFLEKNGEKLISTSITKYLTEGIGTDVVRDFADSILMFDRFLTYTKFRIVNYTPHILLSVETKETVFNELYDGIYRQVFDIIIKKDTLAAQVFGDMESDPVDEVPEIKPENGALQDVKMETEVSEEVKV